jgi:hypothetical protein
MSLPLAPAGLHTRAHAAIRATWPILPLLVVQEAASSASVGCDLQAMARCEVATIFHFLHFAMQC